LVVVLLVLDAFVVAVVIMQSFLLCAIVDTR